MNTARPADVISWDIHEDLLSDGSKVFDVIGTSDECRVSFHCASESAAEDLVSTLDSFSVTGTSAEAIRSTTPDLLHIAVRLEAMLTRQRWLVDGNDPESVLLRDARAAIAKVNGGTS